MATWTQAVETYKEYFPTGTRTSPNIDLSAIKNATTTSISWTSIEHTGTSIIVEVSRDGGSWVEVTNGGSIPVITAGEDLTGSYLQTRITLSTSDTSITPQLSSLNVIVNEELNTEVNIEARFVGDATWIPLTNGQPIPFINSGDDLTGKTLEFRQILNTEDVSITPVLTNFTINIDSIAGVRVFTKLDTDPDWIEIENGSTIPGVSFGSNLNGRTLQVKTELNTVDTSYTPTLKWINYGVDWNTSVLVETQLNGSGWKTAVSGEPIPDVMDNDDLTGKTLQVRTTLESGNRDISPRLKTLFYKVFERGSYVTYKIPIYETFYLPQGIFVLRNPQITSENSYSTINISGIDKFSLLDGQLGGNLESTYIIDVGSNINTAIRSILSKTIDENAQFPIDAKVPILQNLIAPTDITPYTIRKELGGKFADILLELNGMVSRNMYYNPLGHFVFEEDFDDAIKGSVWNFTQDEFLYLGSTHEYKFEDLYNKVIVVSDNVDGGLYVATATNTNPASKTNINAIGVKIAEPIVDNVIYTQDLAQIRANYELKRLNAMQSAISLRSVPMFHLDVDKVITLTDDRLGLNQERFLLQDINIPLGFGQEMTVSAVKTIDLALD